MKRVVVLSLFFITVFSLSSTLVSANVFSDFFHKIDNKPITGKIIMLACSIDSDCPDGQLCGDMGRCVSSTQCPINGNYCTSFGSTRCYNGFIQSCQTDSGGCFQWNQGTQCSSGLCLDTLSCLPSTSPCNGADGCILENSKRCSTSTNPTPQTCKKDSLLNCFKWVSDFACAAGYACSGDGQCAQQTSTPLSISLVSPSGQIPSSSSTIQLSITTNKAATCSYSSQSTSSTQMSSTGGTTHSQSVSVSRGSSYVYSLSCRTGAEIATNTISFSVAAASVCTNECTISGNTKCSTNGLLQTCGNVNTDSCLHWNTGTVCSLGLTCQTNAGTSSCVQGNLPACIWTYNEDASTALCVTNGKLRAVALPSNFPCDESNTPNINGHFGYILNDHGSFYGTISGWSKELPGTCNNDQLGVCGWTACHPDVGKIDSNCKTPDGTLVSNDLSTCHYGGGFGTQGDWSNYACPNFEPTRKLRFEMGGNLNLIKIGTSSSCLEIQREAYLNLYGLLSSYSSAQWGNVFFQVVPSLTPTQRAGALQECVSLSGANGQAACATWANDIGLTGNGNTDSPSWKNYRINQFLYGCFVPGYGSPTILANGDIKIFVSGQIIGNAFDTSLDINTFKQRCQNLVKGGTECTASSTNSDSSKVCYNGLWCAKAPAIAACPSYMTWPVACDSSGNRTRTCGDCSGVITEKGTCPSIAISGSPTGQLICRTSSAEIRVAVNRNAECRYSKTSTSFDSMVPFSDNIYGGISSILVSAQVSDLSIGQNIYNVRCKVKDGKDSGTIYTGTISFNNPSTTCESQCPCNGNPARVCTFQSANGVSAMGCFGGTITPTVNLSAPTLNVNLVSPNDGSNLQNNLVTLMWDVTDRRYKISNVTLFIDGKANYTSKTGVNGSYQLEQNYSSGYHNWSVGAINNQSVVMNSTNQTFSVLFSTASVRLTVKASRVTIQTPTTQTTFSLQNAQTSEQTQMSQEETNALLSQTPKNSIPPGERIYSSRVQRNTFQKIIDWFKNLVS